MVTIAVLCCARNSVYHKMDGVECYDTKRDARSFAGGMPIVAHPPCRAWSAFCAHQAKPLPGERDLGLWCCDQLRECGGALEQPAHSRLFSAGGLPMPGTISGDLWTMEVWQRWWGYSMKKATWLCFSRVRAEFVDPPFVLHDSGGLDRRRQQVMSHNQRAATCTAFAEWLVAIARNSHGRELNSSRTGTTDGFGGKPNP